MRLLEHLPQVLLVDIFDKLQRKFFSVGQANRPVSVAKLAKANALVNPVHQEWIVLVDFDRRLDGLVILVLRAQALHILELLSQHRVYTHEWVSLYRVKVTIDVHLQASRHIVPLNLPRFLVNVHLKDDLFPHVIRYVPQLEPRAIDLNRSTLIL